MTLAKAHLPWHTYDAIKAQYETEYPTAPYLLAQYANNQSNYYSFNLHYIVYFYVDMHSLSGDTSWLDLAVLTVDHMLDNTDEMRDSRGEITIVPYVEGSETVGMYYQAPYPLKINGIPSKGWSSTDGVPATVPTGTIRNQALQDGQILGCFAYFADYVLQNNLTAYAAKANEYLDYCKVIIDMHEPSWREDFTKYISGTPYLVQGAYSYPAVSGGDITNSSPLAYNHMGGMLTAALVYHHHRTEPVYLQMAEKFIGFLRDYREDVDDRYFFKYVLTGSTSEDINHGSYYLTPLLMFAYNNGYASVDNTEMTGYANSLVYAWLNTAVGDVAERFDGTGIIPLGEAFNVGQMSGLGQFNSDVYNMARDLTAISFIGNYPSQYFCYSQILINFPESIR